MASNKRTVLITGCSEGGIGAAVALEYQQRGYHVFATTRNTKKIPSSLTTLPAVTALSLDVTSPQSISSAVRDVSKATGGKLDVLVNNSGAALTAATLDTEIEHARNMFEVNVLGVLAVTKAFTPLLMKGSEPCIVNNSSINGETNLPFTGKSMIALALRQSLLLAVNMLMSLVRCLRLLKSSYDDHVRISSVRAYSPWNPSSHSRNWYHRDQPTS